MPMPKVGDMVRLKPAEVLYISHGDTKWPIHARLAIGAIWIGEDDVEEILPRPFKVGDKVVCDSAGSLAGVAEVKGICGAYAWLLWPRSLNPMTREIADLRHAD